MIYKIFILMALYLEVAILYCRVRAHKDIGLLTFYISEEEPHYNLRLICVMST